MVNAPSSPVVTSRRSSGEMSILPVKRANSHPIAKDPATLTSSVPRGKRGPKASTTAVETPWRARAPTAPPIATARIWDNGGGSFALGAGGDHPGRTAPVQPEEGSDPPRIVPPVRPAAG